MCDFLVKQNSFVIIIAVVILKDSFTSVLSIKLSNFYLSYFRYIHVFVVTDVSRIRAAAQAA